MTLQRFRLLRERAGNFGIMFALSLPLMIIGIGTALDYSVALNAYTRMQQAADEAAIASIAEQAKGVKESFENGTEGKLELAESDARAMFLGNLDEGTAGTLDGVKISVNRDEDGFTSSVIFNGHVETAFLRIVGRNTIKIGGAANAAYVPNKYIDFTLMLDNSPSMGLGATTTDIDKLEALTKSMPSDGNCAFACHVENSTSDYYTLAKNNGITTRIQMVALASQKMIETAASTRRYADQYQMAVYSLGEKAQTAGLYEVAKPSTDLKDVQTKTGTIDLMSIPSHSYPNVQTDLISALTNLSKTLGKGGDGSSSKNRQKVLFLVTDGVEDATRKTGCIKRLSGTRCQAPLDYTICNTIKANGVRIAVLYTTYLAIENNSWYRSWIKPFRSEIGANLQACATNGLYFEVSPSAGITEAMDALFQKVVTTPRLTN